MKPKRPPIGSKARRRLIEWARMQLLSEIDELRLIGIACNVGASETRANRFTRRAAREMLKVAKQAVKEAKIEGSPAWR